MMLYCRQRHRDRLRYICEPIVCMLDIVEGYGLDSDQYQFFLLRSTCGIDKNLKS